MKQTDYEVFINVIPAQVIGSEALSGMAKIKPGQELVYVDGLNMMLEEGREIYAQEIQNSEYHDCGSKLGYLKTIVDLALRHEDLKDDFKAYLKKVVNFRDVA